MRLVHDLFVEYCKVQGEGEPYGVAWIKIQAGDFKASFVECQ